jgi:hypothetical protein
LAERKSAEPPEHLQTLEDWRRAEDARMLAELDAWLLALAAIHCASCEALP